MPVRTVQSEAGTGEVDATIHLSEIVVTAITLANPNSDEAEGGSIKLYSGPSAEGINYHVLASGWANTSHAIEWRGRLNLKGDYTLVGTLNHGSSVKHRLSVLTEDKRAMPEAMWDWEGFWQRRSGR